MIKIIGATYEQIEEIGSGGGGRVFLAKHKRLNKKVVLKADKRKLTTREDLLRREVDVLKNLSNTYIPQVYDFFVEDGVVYTAMEYIDGESLDKPLKRGERFPQATVIKWAIQLLSALKYLHEPVHGDPPRGYVHSDIKPANLMLRSNGDISLIDFNIALALGEEFVIGGSAGYASPEHYGLDFSSSGNSSSDSDVTETETREGATTETEQCIGENKKIVPDVRSDIYSVGATLYHLLSGRRPAKNALDVIKLSKNECSELVIEIIAKAMNPNPELRYQTADEMMKAFLSLRQNDKRSIRLRRMETTILAGIMSVMVIGIICSFTALKRMQIKEKWLKLIEYAKEAREEGDNAKALEYIFETIPDKESLLVPKLLPESQRELTEALGVYDLQDSYKGTRTIELPSAPLMLKLSPEADTVSCLYKDNLALMDVHTGELIASLSTDESALSEVEYLDDNTVVYAGKEGITAYDIKNKEKVWTGSAGTGLAVSAEGNVVASVYRDDEFITIYDAKTGMVRDKIIFSGKKQSVANKDLLLNPKDNLFELNSDGSVLAISFDNGSSYLVSLNDENKEPMELTNENEGFNHFEGGFFGKLFAYAVTGPNKYQFRVADLTTGEIILELKSNEAYSISVDETGIYMGTANKLVRIDPETGEQKPMVTTTQVIKNFAYDGAHTMIARDNGIEFYDENAIILNSVDRVVSRDLIDLKNGVAIAGNSGTPIIGVYEFKREEDKQFARYPNSDKHTETRACADKEHVTLYDVYHFTTYTLDGQKTAEVIIPEGELVYDQEYIRENNGSFLEVTYNDGHVVKYDVMDGAIVSQRVDTDISDDYLEEFETNDYLISSPLHGAPSVIDKRSGKELKKLEQDDYLTYIDESEGMIIAYYITPEFENYGMLMDKKCNVIGKVPYLCDVYDHEIYTDNGNGIIRKEQIYGWNELLKKAEEMR